MDNREIVITDRDVPPEVVQAVADGRKIVAIKILRESTGLGLANAKVIVDRLASKQERSRPRTTAISRESPFRAVVGVGALLLALVVAWRYFSG